MPEKKPHFTQFGPYLMLRNGADGTIEERSDALTKMVREMMRTEAQNAGIKIDLDGEITVYFEALRVAQKIVADAKSHGISENLRKLLQAPTKRDAEKAAAALILRQEDLVALTLRCDELGLKHRFFKKEFLPADVGSLDPPEKLTEDGETKRLSKEGKRWFKKIGHIFEQRQNIHVHLFESETAHHFFFFTYSDILGKHWIGDHVHYTSHLWCVPKEDTFRDFETRGERPVNVHIKYQDQETKAGLVPKEKP